ncbi:YgaP family membrane protein [Robertmurraya kyonggiensis]|uniref:DUF2892 domain-containing protein n=1 Tax=Robertmurraya kyonggiensis TaxID=1037680 RepID=A0A4U1D1C4_9BACI|nr:DUF2892 domain-containing protein [Robertmurraya kyonggiensis]TKC14806.1 DUF2892 domain-containing protein [Robertmurraya kyonggiensis]
MKIQQNIGILNALIRITCGLTLLSWTTAKMAKKPWRESYLLLALTGAMKVAEGIVRYCPVTSVVKSQMDSRKNGEDSGNEQQDEMLPYNPT